MTAFLRRLVALPLLACLCATLCLELTRFDSQAFFYIIIILYSRIRRSAVVLWVTVKWAWRVYSHAKHVIASNAPVAGVGTKGPFIPGLPIWSFPVDFLWVWKNGSYRGIHTSARPFCPLSKNSFPHHIGGGTIVRHLSSRQRKSCIDGLHFSSATCPFGTSLKTHTHTHRRAQEWSTLVCLPLNGTLSSLRLHD